MQGDYPQIQENLDTTNTGSYVSVPLIVILKLGHLA